MPITPAHAAAAWPLHRAAPRLPLAALVIGTLSPDLEYVLRLRPYGKFGHSPQGLVLFCLPATLLLWWGWTSLVRPALTPLLPPAIRARAEAPPPGRRADRWMLATIAALAGAVTHVLWDGFTHENGWGLALVPSLDGVAIHRWGVHWYIVAQYASSALGVLVVAVWIMVAWLRHPSAERAFAPGQRARIARLALLVAVAAAAAAVANAMVVRAPILALGRAAVGAEAGFALALVCWSLRARSLARPQPGA